jgi:hypothetical protein
MKMQRGHGAPRPRSPEVGSEQRLQTLQARVERLEMELEGLQDALYRHEVLQDRSNGQLIRRSRSRVTSAGKLRGASCDRRADITAATRRDKPPAHGCTAAPSTHAARDTCV